MADGTDEDEAHAARMDEWIAWESVRGTAHRGTQSWQIWYRISKNRGP
jgi:hypothetical protein